MLRRSPWVGVARGRRNATDVGQGVNRKFRRPGGALCPLGRHVATASENRRQAGMEGAPSKRVMDFDGAVRTWRTHGISQAG